MNAVRRQLLACGLAAVVPAGARASGPVSLYIATAGDEMRFVPDRLECAAHTSVELHFHHAGRISSDAHDWVLLQRGSLERFLAIADRQSGDGAAVSADAADVLAATPLCPRGGRVRVRFRAPAAGEYPFVCSVPGHGESMRGVLLVRAGASAAQDPVS